MLTLTTAAAEVVRDITTHQGTPGESGVRIAAQESFDGQSLALSVAPAPAAQDQVLIDNGARVFLDPEAAEYLSDKVLHAQLDAGGKAEFTIRPQHLGNGGNGKV